MKALVYATGPLGERLAGPEIRALQFAHALRCDYEVTLMAERPEHGERDGFRVLASGRRRLFNAAMQHDVIISPCMPLYLLMLKDMLGFVAISDLYDPYEVELVALESERHDRELHMRGLARSVYLRCADVVLCAGEQQRENLIRSAGRLRPARSVSVKPVVVPFAIPDAPPSSGRQVLREQFPQIGPGDTVVLWWGAVWKWLDIETPIRAFATFADSRPDVKLVITAGSPPNASSQRFDAVNESRKLARDLGVLDRTVLFLDEWIPYEDRWDYLYEADIGLTLHRFAAEAELAARSRYVDYVSASLPCVLGRGDQLASEFEAAGFATLIDDTDPQSVAGILLALADDGDRRDAAAEAGRRLVDRCKTSTTSNDLRVAIRSASSAKSQLLRTSGVMATLAATRYYTYRFLQVLRPRSGRGGAASHFRA